MADDTPDSPGSADIRIQPSVRQITRLQPTSTSSGQFGVLTRFAGVLSTDAGASTGPAHHGGTSHLPTLSYLTLQPLVVEHLRERTERTVERVERSVERTGDEEPATDDVTNLTVREFLRQERREGGDEGPGTGDGPSRQSDYEGTAPADWRSDEHTLAGPPERGRESDDERQVRDADGPPGTVRRPDRDSGESRPGSHTGEHVGGEDTGTEVAREGAMADVEDRVAGRDVGPEPGTYPWTTLDRGRSDRDDGPTGPVAHSAGADLGDSGPETATPMGPDRGGPERPSLVLAERPMPTVRPSPSASTTDGPSLTVESRATTDHDDGGPAQAEPDTKETHSVPTEQRVRPGDRRAVDQEAQPGATERDGPRQVIPLDFDAVDRPTLDRFVEQLSDELARHERIERERRGL